MKTKSFLLGLFLIGGLGAAHAAQFGDFTYYTDGKAVEITSYRGPGGAASIPETVNNLPVTRIAVVAFIGVVNLTNIVIPSSVISIGDNAFFGCTGLAGIEVHPLNPAYSGFEGVLFNKSGTTLILCPPGKAGSYTVPDKVASIGRTAFVGCKGLTSILIPNSVTNIAESAFSGCTGLTSMVIPSSVTSIAGDAFSGCRGLASVEVHPLNPVYSGFEGVLFNKTGPTLIQCPPGKAGSYTVPDKVAGIGRLAFGGCKGLTTIVIPSTVISIGDDAFFDCTGLAGIEVHPLNPLYSSFEGVLFSKTGSTLIQYPPGKAGSYIVPERVFKIERTAPSLCTNLASIVIPISVTSIGDRAFSYCSGLPGITIPNSVTSVGNGAFEGCTGLTSVAIGNGVTSIAESAFSNCAGLTSVTIGSGVTRIERVAFSSCKSLASIVIPDSVTSIAESAFSGCSGLTSVTIGNGVTKIPQHAFSGCNGLTSMVIPDNVTSIGTYAFWNCTGLTSVTIGNHLTSIGLSTFVGCTGLTSVYFLGNAPWVPYSPGVGASLEDSSATVYYLPGTTGWKLDYGGRPTALWIRLSLGGLPQTIDSPLKLLSGSPAPATVRVQRSANLRDWEDWTAVNRDQGPSELYDSDASTPPYRFYRFVEN